MRRRLLFHFFHFLVLCVMIALSVGIYFKFGYNLRFTVINATRFIDEKIYNFALIALGIYFLCYLTGLIKYTMEEKTFRFVAYLKEVFKLVVIIGMIAFLEFFIFFEGRIGRVIYLILFTLFSFYLLLYWLVRSGKEGRQLLWMAAEPAETIMEDYIRKPGAFRVIKEESEREKAGLDIHVVYQDGHVDEETSEALIKSKLAGYTVVELADLIERETAKIPLDFVNLHWFLEKFDVADRAFFRLNRAFNILVSMILLLLLFPFGFLSALIHRLFSPGPLFFTQERLGLHGTPFRLFKFRTMVQDAEKSGARFSTKDDPRITPVGKLMRKLRLDEIPQLLNVLKGEMSMVGPRPERAVFIESLGKEIPYYKLRLLVPPGLTGWAQINGAYAGEATHEHREKLEFDLYYIKNRSIFLDLLILLQTIQTMLLAKGS